MASTPAPTIVLTRLMTEEAQEAVPCGLEEILEWACRRRERREDCDVGREEGGEGEGAMVAFGWVYYVICEGPASIERAQICWIIEMPWKLLCQWRNMRSDAYLPR